MSRLRTRLFTLEEFLELSEKVIAGDVAAMKYAEKYKKLLDASLHKLAAQAHARISEMPTAMLARELRNWARASDVSPNGDDTPNVKRLGIVLLNEAARRLEAKT